ncbi:MAG: major facilitator superfamily 1 [Rhodoferax sp.]|nr:major facilitator superfamily 1 [Rhodoferax sp.]
MSDSPPSSAPTENGWTELCITLAIQATASMALLTLPAAAPLVGEAIGVAPSLIGVFIGLAYCGCIVGSLGAGAAIQRWGAIRVSQAGLVAGATGLLLCCTGAWPAMLAAALIMGLGYGPITPASSHLLIRNTPPHRLSLVFSLKQTGVPLGGLLAGAIAPGLMLAVGWRTGLSLIALACLVCVVVSQPLRRTLDAQRLPGARFGIGQLGAPIRLVLGQGQLRSLAISSAYLSAIQLIVTTYTVIYLHVELGFGLIAAGLALSVCQAAGMVGRVAWGQLADSGLGARRTLMGLTVLVVLCCLGMATLPAGAPVSLVLALLALFGATAIGWNGVVLAEVARRAPHGSAGMATGGTSALTFLGVVIGPPAFSLVATLTGSYRNAYFLMAALVVWSLIGLRRMHR